MADKLRDSVFLGERVINFTASILNGVTRLSPINAFEIKLLKKEDSLKELNKELDGNLVKLLKDAMEYITPPTALRILFYFKGLGRTMDGHKIIFFATRDQQVLTEEEITELVGELKKDPTANIELWIALLAGEPDEPLEVKKNTLSLPKDFR